MARIVFFNRFYSPDNSATSQLLTDLAVHLGARGHDVHVVTAKLGPAHAGEEMLDGVHVHRHATPMNGSQHLPGRLLAYLAFWRAARAAAGAHLSRNDIAVTMTDPPLLSAAVCDVAVRRGARVVLWMQDLYPEVAERHGIPGLGGPIGSWLRGRRDASLRLAARIVPVSDGMAGLLVAKGAPPERVQVIANWADGDAIRPQEASDLRRAWGVSDALVVGYSGTLGRAHEFETLLGAARLLRDEAGVRFVLVGGGPRLPGVRERAREEGLGNVQFVPRQPRAALGATLAAIDVHVSTLRPELEGLILPSKVYGILAAGRPAIFVGDPRGESARLLQEAGAGLAIAQGDSRALADAILSLRVDRARREQMGANGRRAFEERYERKHSLARWDALLAGMVAARP